MKRNNSTLLVAGDSFAQFPRKNLSVHWCEKWAADANMNSVSSGIQGGAIPVSAHRAMHEIIKNTTITHCIFFISQPFRTTIRLRNQNLDLKNKKSKKQYINRFLDWNDQWTNNTTEKYFEQSSNDRIIHYGTNFATIEKPIEKSIEKTHICERMDAATKEQFLTGALSSLSSLGYICQAREIKLIFTSGFPTDQLWYDWVKNIMKLPVYDYFSTSNVSMSDINVTSHYTEHEHKQLYDYLKSTSTYHWIN